MKAEISIKHSTYMMTIAEVIVAIEELTEAKVVKIMTIDDKLTFVLEHHEPEAEAESYDPDIHGYPDEIYEERERKSNEGLDDY
jgi:hypothetical protein